MSILWRLTPKLDKVKEGDYLDILVKVSNGEPVNLTDKYNVSQVNNELISADKIINEIAKFGFSAWVKMGPIHEELVSNTATATQIVNIFHKYLDNIGINDELIIIDPYFFATSTPHQSYIDLVLDILSKYLPVLKHITVITNTKVNATVKQDVTQRIRTISPAIVIEHKQTNKYHDRFWISNNRNEGLITGSSLNGYGKKYALVDRLEGCDVSDIINSLKTNGLII